MTSPAKSTALLVRMPAELHDTIKRMADADDLSMAQFVRRVLRSWVASVESNK